jgi:hypothetical protein
MSPPPRGVAGRAAPEGAAHDVRRPGSRGGGPGCRRTRCHIVVKGFDPSLRPDGATRHHRMLSIKQGAGKIVVIGSCRPR